MAEPSQEPAPSAPTSAPVTPPETPPETPPGQSPAEPTSAWNENLSAEILGHEKLQGIDSLEALATAVINSPEASVVPNVEDYGYGEEGKTFAEFANKTGLTKEQADSVQAFDVARTAAVDATYTKGLDELKAGDWKDNFEANIDVAKSTLSHYDKDGALNAMLTKSREGNNPLIVKFLHAVGKDLMSEDKLVLGGQQGSVPKSHAQTLYGDK